MSQVPKSTAIDTVRTAPFAAVCITAADCYTTSC